MTLSEICTIISLPTEVTEQVLSLSASLDWQQITPYLDGLKGLATRADTYKQLTVALGDDPAGMKMLSLMLRLAANAHEEYEKRGISETIFKDTMKFCTRFTTAHQRVYGWYAFEWGWWFPRQAFLWEFRIGELEYEMTEAHGEKLIHLHIPADASLNREGLRDSVARAKSFFQEKFPSYASAPMVCDSWLLSPKLKEVLSEGSRILDFQKGFDLLSINEDIDSCLLWVYDRTDYSPEALPETTSLQRNIKKQMVAGKHMGDAFGRLKQDPWR